jgi:hypothetical protein
MRILAYKLITHSRMVGFVKFKDGNIKNYNVSNLEKVNLNCVINSIIDETIEKENINDIYKNKSTKLKTNWDIVFTECERKYIKKYSREFANFIYNEM